MRKACLFYRIYHGKSIGNSGFLQARFRFYMQAEIDSSPAHISLLLEK